jgi:hypothetical protein
MVTLNIRRGRRTFWYALSQRLSLIAIVLGLWTAPLGAAQSPQAVADLRGIYVYTALEAPSSSPEGQATEAALNLPGADGMLLVGLWSSVEPAKDQFTWTNLDRWVSFATSHGKKITLVIRAGDGTPSWLFQPPPSGAGATPLTFTISPHDGMTNGCITETIAAPWDPAFLGQWDSLLSAMSAHLKMVGTYQAITALRLTGINRTSDELRLPAETAASTGLSCVSDSVTTWLQAGYRPSLLLSGWDAVTSSFGKYFPDKSFSVAIITNPPQIPFPAIAEDGSVITGPVPDQNPPLLQLASQKFPGRLVVQFNFLLPGTPANPFVVQAAQTLGTLAAFQTNNFYSLTSGGAACAGSPANPVPCTDATYLDLLQTGIYPLGQSNSLRAQYIEVWAVNANAFPDDIQQAHVELTPDILTLEVAKQKGNGKLIVYVTGTDPNATLSIAALPEPPEVMPIILGDMSKTSPTGNEFFLIKKGLPPIASVQITSTSGGTLTTNVKGH